VVVAVASYVIDLAAAIPIGVTGHAIFVGAPLLLFGLTVVLPRPRSPRPTLDRFRPWLAAAAVYNGVWGIGALALAPDLGWKVVGLVVLAYAPGYWWASRFPDRHPHLVAVGLFGKTLGPLAYGVGAAMGRASDALFLVIVTNDLVWWPAFAAYLHAAAQVHGGWRAFLKGA
jgi:hypothetical protein